MATRLFTFSEGSADKFWNITREGASYTVQYGRAGAQGQTQTKSFESDAAAEKATKKLIEEKVKKGYVETVTAEGDRRANAAGKTNAAPPTAAAANAVSPLDSEMAAEAPPSTPPSAVLPKAKHNGKAATPASDDAQDAASRQTSEPALPSDNAEQLLALAPDDWQWATWRPRIPLPRPQSPPFDVLEAASRLANVTATGRYGMLWNWDKAQMLPGMTREEAHFWFRAISEASWNVKLRSLAAALKKQAFDGTITQEQAEKALTTQRHITPTPHLLLPLGVLLGTVGVTNLVLDADPLTNSGKYYYHSVALISGLKRFVLPYATSAEWHTLQEITRGRFAVPGLWGNTTPPNYAHVPFACHLAAYLGLHDLCESVVSAWPDDMFAQPSLAYAQRPQEMIFGLNSAVRVETEMRRLKLVPQTPYQIRAWLAHTEAKALDVVRDGILAEEDRDAASELVEAFALARVPEAAPFMLQLMLDSRAPRPARTWLNTYHTHASTGLVPLAGGRGKLAEAAQDYLRDRVREGEGDKVQAALAGQPKEIADRVRALVLESHETQITPFDTTNTPHWLLSATAKAWPAGANWLQASDLPPLIVNGMGSDRAHRLNNEQLSTLVQALIKNRLEAPDPLVRAVREHATPASRDAFVWKLFQTWLGDGAPANQRWALLAIGALGGDGSALRLAPVIRQWPGESQHQRAVTGLDVLRTIGSDTALMQINGIAQKVAFKGLKTRAGECMEAIAKDRNLSREQLEDRIVPDCDLDAHGTRIFDFGSRAFSFVFGPDMKPMVRDAAGTIKPDLPKPTTKDDAEKANAALAEWKLLKKTIVEAAKIQVVRLESAMITGRRWPVTEFELLLVHHPLMTNLTRMLVWGAYDDAGKLQTTFRVTEDQTYADSKDDTATMDRAATVGIVHPMHLSPEERATWGELLSDYEIVPPFPQLGRPVYTLKPGEAESKEINRFADIAIPAVTLAGMLEKMGWTRGMPQDGGVFSEHTRPFYAANVTAIVEYPGVPVGYMMDWEDQKITHAYFVPGIYKSDWTSWRSHEHALWLGEVDPVVVSEVLRSLSALAAKGK